MYRDFNKNCSYEKAPARLNYLIHLFEEADLACYKKLVQLLKNWKPEIINSFSRPYDSNRQSNALVESYNQKLLDQKKSPISWIHTVFPSRYSRIFLLSKPRVILERQIAKTTTDFT